MGMKIKHIQAITRRTICLGLLNQEWINKSFQKFSLNQLRQLFCAFSFVTTSIDLLWMWSNILPIFLVFVSFVKRSVLYI